MDKARPTALIIGAGIAGLTSAIALARGGGGTVRVFERSPVLAPIGAALSIWANAVDALDSLGLGQAIFARATRIDRMAVLARNGQAIIGPRQVCDTPYLGARAFMITRAALQEILLAAIDPRHIVLDAAIASVGQDATGVSVRLASGEVVRGDIAVVADGIWSTIAATLIGGAPRHRGYGGVIALSGPVANDIAEHCAYEYWGRGARFGLCDIGAGRRYWFHMRNQASPDEASGLTHDHIVDAAIGWPPEIGAAVAATPADSLIPFSIHAKPPPKRLGEGRIFCIGDAAHAMEPNLGQGACQAIEDAVALGMIAGVCPPDAMMPIFERLRVNRIAGYVRRSAEGSRPSHSRSTLVRGAMRLALGVAPTALTDRVIARMHLLPDYETLARRG